MRRWRLPLRAFAVLLLLLSAVMATTAANAGAVAVSDDLTEGAALGSGQSLVAANNAYTFTMQTDGNLVLRSAAGSVLWTTDTPGHSGSTLTLQSDGNLVLRALTGKAIWTNGARGTGARLLLQTDGNLVERSASNAVLWTRHTVVIKAVEAPVGTLLGGQRLLSGHTLSSAGSGYTLVLQSDGNAVLRKAGKAAYWTSQTIGHPGAYLVMQTDGNLIIRASNGVAVWASRTSGHALARLVLQTDGNLVIRSSANAAIWQTGAYHAPLPPTIAPNPSAANCDPAYPGVCLHDGIGDYDCAGGSGNGPNYVQGPIEVLPPDPFGLDSDGNGIGCES